MHHPAHRQTLPRAICLSALFASCMALGHAEGIQDPDAQYLRETQTCKEGRSGQNTDTCITEARRALDARKKGALQTDTSAVTLNARKRCDVLSGEEKTACLARMNGVGSTSGSVKGGGILREVETVVIPTDAASKGASPNGADAATRTDKPLTH